MRYLKGDFMDYYQDGLKQSIPLSIEYSHVNLKCLLVGFVCLHGGY